MNKIGVAERPSVPIFESYCGWFLEVNLNLRGNFIILQDFARSYQVFQSRSMTPLFGGYNLQPNN